MGSGDQIISGNIKQEPEENEDPQDGQSVSMGGQSVAQSVSIKAEQNDDFDQQPNSAVNPEQNGSEQNSAFNLGSEQDSVLNAGEENMHGGSSVERSLEGQHRTDNGPQAMDVDANFGGDDDDDIEDDGLDGMQNNMVRGMNGNLNAADEQPETNALSVWEAEGLRKHWRACLTCKLLQTVEQFNNNGCPNCPHKKYNDMEADEVKLFTSGNWTGILAHFQPGGWLKRATHFPERERVLGTYAVEVKDEMLDLRESRFPGEVAADPFNDLDDFIDDTGAF